MRTLRDDDGNVIATIGRDDEFPARDVPAEDAAQSLDQRIAANGAALDRLTKIMRELQREMGVIDHDPTVPPTLH